MPMYRLCAGELGSLVDVPKEKEVRRTILMNRDLEKMVLEFCRRNNISFSRLVRILLVSLLNGDVNIVVEKKNMVVKADISIVGTRSKDNAFQKVVEETAGKVDRLFEEFNNHMSKFEKIESKFDKITYWTTTNTENYIKYNNMKAQALSLKEDIRKLKLRAKHIETLNMLDHALKKINKILSYRLKVV